MREHILHWLAARGGATPREAARHLRCFSGSTALAREYLDALAVEGAGEWVAVRSRGPCGGRPTRRFKPRTADATPGRTTP